MATSLFLVGGCGLISAIDQLKEGINFKLPWIDQIAGRIDLLITDVAGRGTVNGSASR